jgi:hypothetical protein
LTVTVTEAAKVSFAPSVQGPIIGDCGGMSIPGGNEDDDFAGKRSEDLLRDLLGDRVAVTELAVVT